MKRLKEPVIYGQLDQSDYSDSFPCKVVAVQGSFVVCQFEHLSRHKTLHRSKLTSDRIDGVEYALAHVEAKK